MSDAACTGLLTGAQEVFTAPEWLATNGSPWSGVSLMSSCRE